MLGPQAFEERASLRTIRRGTCCNKDSDRVTMRIHGQMYLVVVPNLTRGAKTYGLFAKSAKLVPEDFGNEF